MNPILLVEDDENDVLFMRKALEQSGVGNPLRVVFDGQQAMDYFNGSGPFRNRNLHPLPCLVLLDLNLPVVSGFEFLHWLRSEQRFRATTVIVLSSSNAEKDVEHAYSVGANSYVMKPSDPLRLLELAGLIKSYWLGWNLGVRECMNHEQAPITQ